MKRLCYQQDGMILIPVRFGIDSSVIAKIMRGRSMAKELKGTVREIIGTCVSVGCSVDGKDPKDLQEEIRDGDVEIPDDN